MHPFEIATTAAIPKDERNARKSFMMRIEFFLGRGRGIEEVKSRDEETSQVLNILKPHGAMSTLSRHHHEADHFEVDIKGLNANRNHQDLWIWSE